MLENLKNEKQILLALLLHEREENIFNFFAVENYSISASSLEVLYLRRFSKHFILKCLEAAHYVEDFQSLHNWLCGYLGQEEAENFLLQQCNLGESLLQYISADALEKHQYWDELSRRKADDILYKHGLYDKMSPSGLYKYRMFEKYFKKAYVINPEDNDALEYLAQTENWDIVYKNFKVQKDNQNLINFLIKHKQYTMIANENRMLLTTFSEGIEYLQEIKSFFHLAEAGLYDKVDWDAYLQSEIIASIKHSEKAKQWDALMRNHKHWALFKHFRLWRFIKSFF